MYQSFFLKFLILYGHRVKTEKVRHIIFNGPEIINNGASDRRLARIRTKWRWKIVACNACHLFQFYPWNLFYCFYNKKKKQPNATATCVILQINLPQNNNEGFFNFEEVLKMTILKTKIAECWQKGLCNLLRNNCHKL